MAKKGLSRVPFIVQQKIGKKTYLRNEKGQFVSTQILEFQEPDKVIQGTGKGIKVLKDKKTTGIHIPRKKGVKYAEEQIFGQSVRNRMNASQNEGRQIILSRKGENIKITPKSLVVAQSFQYDAEDLYIKIFGQEYKVVDSPQLRVRSLRNPKTHIFEYERFVYGEKDVMENSNFYKARLKYNKELDKLWDKYFKK